MCEQSVATFLAFQTNIFFFGFIMLNVYFSISMWIRYISIKIYKTFKNLFSRGRTFLGYR